MTDPAHEPAAEVRRLRAQLGMAVRWERPEEEAELRRRLAVAKAVVALQRLLDGVQITAEEHRWLGGLLAEHRSHAELEAEALAQAAQARALLSTFGSEDAIRAALQASALEAATA